MKTLEPTGLKRRHVQSILGVSIFRISTFHVSTFGDSLTTGASCAVSIRAL
jgi:hypothetical protein